MKETKKAMNTVCGVCGKAIPPNFAFLQLSNKGSHVRVYLCKEHGDAVFGRLEEQTVKGISCEFTLHHEKEKKRHEHIVGRVKT